MERINNKQPGNMKLSLDYRVLTIILVVVIVGMLAFWRPWEGVSDRSVEVTGQATVSAVPDEFVFYPSYQFTNADKQAALAELTTKSNDITAKLKELGVAEEKIKTNSGGYDYPIYLGDNKTTPTYTLQFTVTVDKKELAQTVQDYLIGTTPTGSVSPQANFSEAKLAEVENTARDQASKDARAKAEQSAKNLGFSLGAVKTVNDGAGFGAPLYSTADLKAETQAGRESLSIQPGENELTYTVTVTYFVR